MEPDEPCRTHIIPPHMRDDRGGQGDVVPLFKFVMTYKLLPLGIPHRMYVWAAGPDTALRQAQLELVGRFGPFGITDVTLGAPKRARGPKKAKWRVFG